MMASPSRLSDIETRNVVLENMELMLTLYKKYGDQKYWETATMQGELCKKLKDRIERFDYTALDERLKKFSTFWLLTSPAKSG